MNCYTPKPTRRDTTYICVSVCVSYIKQKDSRVSLLCSWEIKEKGQRLQIKSRYQNR